MVQMGIPSHAVHLQYKSSVSKDRYRLARIVDTHPDQYGVIRTVTVVLWDRVGVASEPSNKCRMSKQYRRVGVQHLVVVLPAEEQDLAKETQQSHHTPRGHLMQTRAKARAAARNPIGTCLVGTLKPRTSHKSFRDPSG